MEFIDALRAMVKDNKRIRRRCWKDDGDYWEMRPCVSEDHWFLWTRRGEQIRDISPDLFSTTDWEIVPETMGFTKAVGLLKKDVTAIRRIGWTEFQLEITDTLQIQIRDKKHIQPRPWGWSPMLEDIQAADWIIVPI